MILIMLLQFCISKVVVVDDLGVTDKQHQPPEVARKVINALENTVRNTNDVVLLSNSKGTKRVIGLGMNPSPGYGNEQGGNNTQFGKQDPNQMLGRPEGGRDNNTNGFLIGGSKIEQGRKPPEGLWNGSSFSGPQDSLGGFASFSSNFQGGGNPSSGVWRSLSGNNSYGSQPNPQGFGSGSSRAFSKSNLDGYTPFSFRGGESSLMDTPLDSGGDFIGRASDNMSDASREKRSLISLKMAQSRQKEGSIQNNIDRVLQEIDQITEKIQDTQKMRDIMMSKLHTKRNHLRNLQGNKKEVDVQRGRTVALVRLSRNELLKLSKMIDDQKSKLALLEDEEKIFSDRIKRYDEEYDMGSRELQLDEARMEEIKRNVGELEKIHNILKSRNNELLNERNKESAMRNRLELETERFDRNIVDFI